MKPLLIAYTAIFSIAAIGCYVSVWRASKITDSDVKRGLVGLLLLSGTWAAASVGRLIGPSHIIQLASYIVGLVVGLGTVGAWLYFCSAYAGHDYHRQTGIRRIALLLFLGVVGIKLTNPLHSLYFTASMTTTPFQYLTISLSVIHWVVTGLSYSLTAIGFYLLYELFAESQFETSTLGVLVGLTAVPVLFDVIAFAGLAPNLILPFNYEPIGVAIFAVGVLYAIDETFTAVPRTWRKEFVAEFDNPVLLLTEEDCIRDFNQAAKVHFPDLGGGAGSQLATTAPDLHAAIQSSDTIFKFDQQRETRFYTVQLRPLTSGERSVGEAVILKDVTDIERKRRELERQNSQLADFSTALNHELRNSITVFQGFVDHSDQLLAQESEGLDQSAIKRANNAINRMQQAIGDLSMLARYGQTPDCISDCDVRTTIERAWNACETGAMTYSVETDAVIAANGPRLEKLFCDAFRFAQANGATTVSVDMAGDTLTITENGMPFPTDVVENAFEFGPPVPDGDADMALPNIRLLAGVHEWTTAIDQSYQDGVRIQIGSISVTR